MAASPLAPPAVEALASGLLSQLDITCPFEGCTRPVVDVQPSPRGQVFYFHTSGPLHVDGVREETS